MDHNLEKKMVVWGAGGHALVVADIIRLNECYEIVGFLDDVNPGIQNTAFCGSTILGGREQLAILKEIGVNHCIIAFGNCEARLRLAELMCAKGFSLATAIHPRSIVANDVIIGPGTVIAAGAVINPGVRIGRNVIINTSASVDHECVIEDGVHICPGVRLAGKVTVGRAAWLGIGTTVLERLQIGAGAFVGGGSVVTHDIPMGVLAYGVPARAVRKILNDE